MCTSVSRTHTRPWRENGRGWSPLRRGRRRRRWLSRGCFFFFAHFIIVAVRVGVVVVGVVVIILFLTPVSKHGFFGTAIVRRRSVAVHAGRDSCDFCATTAQQRGARPCRTTIKMEKRNKRR